ncbi:MAG TPA: hypothetical protein VKY89_09470 [Thermoanaerobaculia bacterium]|nr:hypothetical protein [Thermoanaerobaculia bacterium]
MSAAPPGPPAAAAAAALRQVYAIALADLRERMRRYSYLVTLAATLYFVYLVTAGHLQLAIHGQRGVYNSAWIGTLMALSVGVLLSLAGFYLVKNTLDHDRRTGVGEILAATPLPGAAYTVGKALSNFLLLGSILALLAVAAGASQLLAHEETHLDFKALLLPMAALAAPAVAMTAAMAVLFEAVRWLRGSLGNVVYFFFWIGALSLSAVGPGGDLLGFHLVESSFARHLPPAAARATGISLTIGPADAGETGAAGAPTATAATAPAALANPASARGTRPPVARSGVRWQGIEWTPAAVARRLSWLLLPIAVALLAALPFARFDPAREGGRRERRRAARRVDPAPQGESPEVPDRPEPLAVPGTHSMPAVQREPAAPAEPETPAAARVAVAAGTPRTPAALTAPWAVAAPPATRRPPAWAPLSRAANLVVAELRLMLRGRGFWWFAVAAGLWIGGLAAPAGSARAALLALAWIWPLPLWSALGAREAQHGTRPLVLSAPLPPGLQSAAIWVAGVAVTALAGTGVGIRLALAGDHRGLLGWIAGCLFIPTLALVLGTLSGSPRLFEMIYLLLWYLGPMNGVADMDYTGLTPAGRVAGIAWLYLGLTAPLFVTAWAARLRQARG